jgi:hypothetical protein
MAKVPKNWERRLVELAAIHGVTDFLLRGRLTKAESKAFYTILNKLGKPAARTTAGTAARLGGTALRVGKTIALRHPVLTGGALVYYAYKNREELADLAREGYEIIQPQAERSFSGIQEALDPQTYIDAYERRREEGYGMGIGRPEAMIIEKLRGKKKKSKYNRAVSAAMKAVKQSTKGGKKGVISAPKRVFSTVSKAVSKVNKGAKVSAKGITGIAARAARKILGKGKKKPKKRSKGYTITVNR